MWKPKKPQNELEHFIKELELKWVANVSSQKIVAHMKLERWNRKIWNTKPWKSKYCNREIGIVTPSKTVKSNNWNYQIGKTRIKKSQTEITKPWKQELYNYEIRTAKSLNRNHKIRKPKPHNCKNWNYNIIKLEL